MKLRFIVTFILIRITAYAIRFCRFVFTLLEAKIDSRAPRKSSMFRGGPHFPIPNRVWYEKLFTLANSLSYSLLVISFDAFRYLAYFHHDNNSFTLQL